MFLITSGLDTDEVTLCNWKLNVGAKRRVQKCPPWMNEEEFYFTPRVVFLNKLLDFCFGEKRKSRIISRSLLPSSSDFALALCPEQRGVSDMWTHLLHSSQLPGFGGQLFWYVLVRCGGSSAPAVIELLFPHMIVWCSGKNTEGSAAAEEEGVPKVNI